METSKKIILTKIFALMVLFVTGTPVNADEWPKIENPPQAHVVWVGDDLNQNGVPIKIKSFSSQATPEEIINFYNSAWNTGSDLKPVINDFGDWKIIGKQIGDYYLTVQAKQGEQTSSEGFLSVSKLPTYKGEEITTDFPKLGGSEILSKTKSYDPGVTGETIIIKNDYSIQSNVSFYEGKMVEKGWTMTRSDVQPVNGSVSKFLYFKRSKQACSIVINQSDLGQSVIVANVVATKS